MIKPKHLLFLALFSNILTFILHRYAASQSSGTGSALHFVVYWMPLLWGITIVLLITLCLVGRKTLFKRPFLKYTLPLILCCTPIPSWLIFVARFPSVYCASTSYTFEHGRKTRQEEWKDRRTNKLVVEKYFSAGEATFDSDDSKLE